MITTPAEYTHPNHQPDALTVLESSEAAAVVLAAIRELTGQTPSVEGLAVVLGQSALETGDWKSIHCFNFGNAKSGTDLPHTYFRCGELFPDPRDAARRLRYFKFAAPHEPLPEGTPFGRAEHTRQTRFRAFQTAQDGALYHLRLLTSGRYSEAYARALAGDAEGFSHLLRGRGYYTAEESTYTKGVVWRAKQCTALARQALGLFAPPSTVRMGSRGPDVAKLQRALGLRDDGIFGPLTRAAVQVWQQRHGLTPDGVVGPVTWGEMFRDP